MTKYGARHQRIRAQLQATIDSGDGWCSERICLMRSRHIRPGAPWDLAHATGDEYLGPAHPLCNRSEGAARGNRQRAHTQRPQRPHARTTSRDW